MRKQGNVMTENQTRHQQLAFWHRAC